jgi:hypothetical protein
MLKAIAWVLKSVIFAFVVLVLGNTVEWRGATVSDQIKMGMSSASNGTWLDHARDWVGGIIGDTSQGSRRKSLTVERTQAEATKEGSEFSGSERQKLRALIRELNQGRAQK